MPPLKDKVALITGGSRGIGKAIALTLADMGCSVAVNYLSDHQSAQDTVKEIEAAGGHAIALQAHVGDVASRKDLWAAFDKTFDHIDFLIANAATGVFKEASKLTLNSLRKVFAVNFEGMVDLANEAVKRMPKGGEPYEAGEKGRIIAISSIGAERVIANYGSIGSSKAAMEAIVRQLAYELGPLGVNCNIIRAGLVDTGILNYVSGKDQILRETIEKTPNGRLVTGKDVAGLVAFIVSQHAAMINGQTLMVDGGYNLMA